jgi:hypothetical protein
MKLWRHNDINQEYERTDEEILLDFFQSQYFKDWSSGKVFNLDRCFFLFITMRDGLDSVIDRVDSDRLIGLLHKDPRRIQQ